MAEPFLRCPSHWQRATLEPNALSGLIVQVETGSTPSTDRDEYWDGSVPWLTPKEVAQFRNNIFVTTTERTITEAGLANCAARILPVGTVMLTKRAPVGAVAINAVPMATNQGFLNFICGPLLRPLYLAYWLKANKLYLDLVANGSTYPELYLNDLFEFELAVPPLEEQDVILQFITALQHVALLGMPLEQSVTSPEKMVALKEQSNRLERICDAVAPLLLSGSLEISTLALDQPR